MLVTFAVLAAAAAISPAIWVSWWVLADVIESRQSRRAAPVVAIARTVSRTPAAADRSVERAA